MNSNENLSQIHTVSTVARWLLAGDVLTGSGFTVTANAFRGVRTPKGKVWVQGHYPGGEVATHEFNANTRMTVKR